MENKKQISTVPASTRQRMLLIALISTILSILVHAYLTTHYYDLKLGTATGPSVCNVNDYLNCDAVTLSKYATFLGIPMALWGVLTNFILLIFIAFTRWNLTSDQDKVGRYAFTISLFTAVVSVVMALISVTQIGNLCLFCMAAYALSLITLGSIALAIRPRFAAVRHDVVDTLFTQHWVLGFLAAIPVMAYLLNAMILESRGFGDIAKIAEEKTAYWQVSPAQSFDETLGLVFQKGTQPPVMTIVEFADYLCPHCKHASQPLHTFTQNHPDVRLIFKPFPLDGTCNSAIQGVGNGMRCQLAYASLCAEKIAQKGWQVHDWIFDRQDQLFSATFDSISAELCQANGLDCPALLACTQSDDMKVMVKKAAAEGEKAQIQGTPTIFVNSKLLNSGQMIPVLDAAYQKLRK